MDSTEKELRTRGQAYKWALTVGTFLQKANVGGGVCVSPLNLRRFTKQVYVAVCCEEGRCREKTGRAVESSGPGSIGDRGASPV